MNNKLIIVTGVGFKSNNKRMEVISDAFDNKFIKPNIGATICKKLVEQGYNVLMLARSPEKLNSIKNSLQRYSKKGVNIDYLSIDLLKKVDFKKLLKKIQNITKIDLVHSVGLSAGSYKIKDNNPYLHVEQIPTELPVKEYEVVIKSLLLLIQLLIPKLKKQRESHIVIISSMSGIRSFPLGFSHSAAKAGLHFATRSLSLELNKDNIYISEIQPGIVNTGMYDNKYVQTAVKEIGEAFGYQYKIDNLPQMPPQSVAEAVLMCLESKSHILSISMVAKGQWPNLGA